MYSLKVLKLSDSGKSAIVEVTKDFGIVVSTVARGFITVKKEAKVGDTLELPATTKVSERTTTSINKETGETTTFTWVVLD